MGSQAEKMDKMRDNYLGPNSFILSQKMNSDRCQKETAVHTQREEFSTINRDGEKVSSLFFL